MSESARRIMRDLAPGLPWAAGAAIARALAGGTAWECAAFASAALAAMSEAASGSVRVLCIILLSAGVPAGRDGPLLMAASALVGLVFATGFSARALFALSVPMVFAASGSAPAAALSAVVVGAAMPESRGARTLLSALGLILAVSITGPPLPGAEYERVIPERISGRTVRWDRFHLDRSSPAAILRIPGLEDGTIGITFEAGGTRDSMPVGLLFVGEAVCAIPPGRSETMLPADGGFVEMRLVRPFYPFEHPVIHVLEAFARDEG